jgi:hypothetical protein
MSNDATTVAQDSGTDGTTVGSSSGGGSEGGGGVDGTSGSHDSASSDVVDGGGLGLLVDNMTAAMGTQISLQVPSGQTPGSYYTYPDKAPNNLGMLSRIESTEALGDTPVTSPVMNADGSQISGNLCFRGSVVAYSGLGMSLAYGIPPDATPDASSSPVPFDASHYHGVSFYVFVEPADGPLPSIHFSIPDTQTADPAAWPAAACNVDGGECDDDFGSDVTFTQGVWVKASFRFDALTQGGFGSGFSALMTSQLIGMKWQVNNLAGLDAASESFNFCISDIYFTP